MIVTGALAWWNESPKDLTACVLALGNIADRIVAVDGAYSRYPAATICSTDAEVRAIRAAAKKAGIECIIIQPDRLWAGQVEKRTFLLREAAKDSDWIVVADADHIVHTDRIAARAAIEAMPAKVRCIGVDFYTPTNDDRKFVDSTATKWHVETAGRTIRMAHIFRSYPDYSVEKKHWFYHATDNGQPVELRYGGAADALIGVPYVVEHRTLFRTRKQILASRAFCNDREMVVNQTGQEDDVPGLPEPVWDYELRVKSLTLLQRDGPSSRTERQRMAPQQPPAKPWSRTEPNRVTTLGEVVSGLRKGYPVATRLRGSGLHPEVRNGDVVVFGQPEDIRNGSLVLVRVRSETAVRRVVGKVGDRYMVDDRHLRPALAKEVYGVVTYHDPRWPEPVPEAVTKPAKVDKSVTVSDITPVPKNKGGRPRKVVVDGRKAKSRK